MYLLKLLCQLACQKHELYIFYSAIVVNCIAYALLAWAGFLAADLINKLNSLLRLCNRQLECFTVTVLHRYRVT